MGQPGDVDGRAQSAQVMPLEAAQVVPRRLAADGPPAARASGGCRPTPRPPRPVACPRRTATAAAIAGPPRPRPAASASDPLRAVTAARSALAARRRARASALLLGPRRPARPARCSTTTPATSRQREARGDRQRRPVLAGELPQPVAGRRRAGLDRLVVQVAARRPGPARWPSRTAASGPSPGTSSRSSRARRAPASTAAPARSSAPPRSTAGRPSRESRALGRGGSSSLIRRRISASAASRSRCRSSGVVPVSSS